MEATAKWDFVGTSSNLLSFNKGSILKVLSLKQEEPHWYLAELNHIIGLVSENMITLEPCDWFYENLKKSKAKKLFLRNPHLKFILRTSLDRTLFLSYSHRLQDEKLWHFKISKLGQNYTFFNESRGPKLFFSLNELAKFVERNASWSAILWIPYKEREEGDSRHNRKAPWSPNN